MGPAFDIPPMAHDPPLARCCNVSLNMAMVILCPDCGPRNAAKGRSQGLMQDPTVRFYVAKLGSVGLADEDDDRTENCSLDENGRYANA